MDRNLALEFVRVTEAAAIAAARWIGRGDKIAADQAAVDEMRDRFNQIDFSGTVVIGEGTKDKAPQLFTGEKVGTGKGPEMDLAIDPLECTSSVAHGYYNALAVIAAGAKGSLLHAPDTYMNKIAVGAEAADKIDLDAPTKDNIKKTAKALGKEVGEITVVVLDRDRHKELIADIRKAGARVRLIRDGDLGAVIAAAMPENDIDMVMGVGASAEAVLSAVGSKVLGGQQFCRFVPEVAGKHDANYEEFGITDLDKIYSVDDLAKGDQLTFTTTGIIQGPLLDGVKFLKNTVVTHSMVMRAKSGTIRYITTHHHEWKK